MRIRLENSMCIIIYSCYIIGHHFGLVDGLLCAHLFICWHSSLDIQMYPESYLSTATYIIQHNLYYHTHIRALSWASLCSLSVVPAIFSPSPVHVFCLTVGSLSSFLPLCSTLNHRAPTQNSPAAEQRNNRRPQDLKRQEAELAESRVPMLICMLHVNHTFIW